MLARGLCLKASRCTVLAASRARVGHPSLSHYRRAPVVLQSRSVLTEVKVVFADISAYHEAADDALAHICEKVEEVSEALDIPGFDLKESGGVLEINLGKNGSYVINKQTPNQQLWFSSPVSGPKRYNYDPNSETWVNTRDGHKLYDLLGKELSGFFNKTFIL